MGEGGEARGVASMQQQQQRGEGAEKAVKSRFLARAAAAKMSEEEDAFDRSQLLRLVLGFLNSLGYDRAVRELEKESGCKLPRLETPKLYESLLAGSWDDAIENLSLLGVADDVDIAMAREKIYARKYLEILASSCSSSAAEGDSAMLLGLECLQRDVQPSSTCSSNLHALSSLLATPLRPNAIGDLCESLGPEALCDIASRSFGLSHDLRDACASREALVASVTSSLHPSHCDLSRRLEELIAQALNSQIARCRYHNLPRESLLDLFADHECPEEAVPHSLGVVLDARRSEVWTVKFSPDGKFLASVLAQGNILLWDVATIITACTARTKKATPSTSTFSAINPVHVLECDSSLTSSIAWSLDSCMLASGGEDGILRVWSASEGIVLNAHLEHADSITSVVWLPSKNSAGASFISGSLDRQVIMWDISGNVLARWSGSRVRDMALLSSGTLLAVLSGEAASITLLRVETAFEPSLVQADVLSLEAGSGCATCDHEGGMESPSSPPAVVGIASSPSGDHLLVQMEGGGLSCWHIPTKKKVSSFQGPFQKRYVLTPCFGGNRDEFVASGSENGTVHVWNRGVGVKVATLLGHTGSANSVAWNSTTVPSLLASGGDDKSICIWVSSLSQSTVLS